MESTRKSADEMTRMGFRYYPDDENVRRCDHCGKPMQEGYYLGGEFACSDECALALYHGGKAQMDEDLSHADEADGECYWTEWDSVYFD